MLAWVDSQKEGYRACVDGLLRLAKIHRVAAKTFEVGSTDSRNSQTGDIVGEATSEQENHQARIGLAELLLAYLSRFPGPYPAETSWACECLQATLLDLMSLSNCSRTPPIQGEELNFSRMTQKIRNEHGISKRKWPSSCFDSFEEIIQLESGFDSFINGDFLLECIALKLIHDRHKTLSEGAVIMFGDS